MGALVSKYSSMMFSTFSRLNDLKIFYFIALGNWKYKTTIFIIIIVSAYLKLLLQCYHRIIFGVIVLFFNARSSTLRHFLKLNYP